MGSSWRWGVVLRLGLLAGGADGLGLLLSQTRYYAVSAVAAGILVLLMLDFLRHTSSSDRELARVIDALGQGELVDRPPVLRGHDTDQPLALAFARALERLRHRSIVAEGERARLSAVVEHAPIPLLDYGRQPGTLAFGDDAAVP